MELILGSPFPFLKLPVEIRIGIYKYAAAFDDMPRKLKVKSAVELQTPTAHAYFGDPRAYMSDLRNQQSIAQPDLFHACSQIYHESRVFFYRHHDFKFTIWQENDRVMSHQTTKRHYTCLERLSRWVDAIGVDMQQQIRTPVFSMICGDSPKVTVYTRFIEDLHARLSDRATVIYRGWGISLREEHAVLSELADVFQDRDTMRKPRFEHATLPVGQEYVSSCDRGPSLTFGPGAGWFGRNS